MITQPKIQSHGGARGGGFRQRSGNQDRYYTLGTDPKCGGTVAARGKSRIATCHRCGLTASTHWWETIGLKGLG